MARHRPKLTKKEQEIFFLLLDAYSYQEIAIQLDIQLITVKKHVSHILEKYECKTTLQLVVNYYKDQLNKGK